MNVNPKVQAVGIAGAVTVVLVWAANLANVTMPPEVASAITTLVVVAAGFIKTDTPSPAVVSAKGLTLLETLVVLLIVLVVLLLVGVVH